MLTKVCYLGRSVEEDAWGDAREGEGSVQDCSQECQDERITESSVEAEHR